MSYAKLVDNFFSPITAPPNLIVTLLPEYLCMNGRALERIEALSINFEVFIWETFMLLLKKFYYKLFQ